jgi:hypothetical protein
MYHDEDEITYVGQEEHDDAIRFLAENFGTGRPSEEVYLGALRDAAGRLVVGDADLEARLERDALLDEIARHDLPADATADDYIASYEAAAKRCDVDLRKGV